MKKHFFASGFLLLLYLCACNAGSDTKTQSEATNTPEVKSVVVNGERLHYVDVGKGEPVVFVHGGYGDYRTWEAQMDAFAKNYRVIAYSRRFAYPNKQILDTAADYSYDLQVKDLAEFIKALKLEPIHLVGHSAGAYTALLTTMEYPELILSLTLGEPPVMSLLKNVPGGDSLSKSFLKEVITPSAEAFKKNQDEMGLEIFINGVMNDSQYYKKLPPRIRDIMLANTMHSKGIVSSAKVGFQPVSCEDLMKIKLPVLLLQGDRSPLFLTSIINEIDRCLSNNEKATLSNASHGLEYENPPEFNKIVLDFIDKH